MKLNLYGGARLLGPLDCLGEYDRSTHHLPAGTVGTVIDLLSGGAVLVDFTVREPRFGTGDEILDYGETCLATLEHDQVEPTV